MTVLVNLGNTLGAGLLAAVFSSMVYGANVWQAYIYFSKYSFDDRNSLRIFVAGLFLIDTVCLALSTHVEYTILVTNFGDLIAELHVPWSFGASGMAATILNACIQNFFSHRVYQVSRKQVSLPAAISVTSLVCFVLGIISVLHLESGVFDQTVFQNRYLIGGLAIQILCDVLITAGMVHYLFSNRGRIQQTNSAISTLTFYSVNCGALNIVCTAAAIACLVQLPQALIWTLFFVCQSKLYFCSFMAILNSREYIRELLHDPGSLMTETHPCHLAKGTEHAAASETTTTNSSTSTGV